MKSIVIILLFMLTGASLKAAAIQNIAPIAVGSSKKVVIIVDFDKNIQSHPDASKYWLVSSTKEKIPCTEVLSIGKRMRFIFEVNAGDFAILEKLISDSSGYYLSNNETIALEEDMINAGELEQLTKDKLPKIDEEDWKKYILCEYASNYLFPHTFNIGTRLGLEDSTKTVYYLELSQSDNYLQANNWFLFWGLKGRWSTDSEDKFNYTQFYPVVAFHNDPNLRLALSSGVEAGYQGFGKQGRGLVKGEVQFRLPYNPIDFTFGNPRWRINPVFNLSFQGNLGWADMELPDSVRHSADIVCAVRYDIPVGKNYYLQTKASGDYSTITKQVLYQYDLSLGYIADGTIRLMADYKQGYQSVTYLFDKQLLFGFAIDVFNESTAK